MGRRSEQRIAMRVPILVRGKDSRGSPFVTNAHTLDITATGASLNGLKGIADIGSKIEIEYQGRKAWYRIQWVGKIGTPRAGHAGVKCLEPGNYIWGVPLAEWEPDTFDPDNAEAPKIAPIVPLSDFAASPASRSERRRFPRASCRLEASVMDEGSSVGLPAKVTDISLGGCYVEMLSPPPVGSPVELTLDSGQGSLRTRGKVLTSQSGMGMAVAFTAIAPEDFERLREIAPPTAQLSDRERARTHPPVTLPPAPSNGAHASKRASQIGPSTQEVLESVLRILLRKGIVSEEEMAEEFEKLMIAKS
ncbi:MAG: PilZ domain-containing protein [Candidatus Acidiferrales bacterium]